MADYSPTLPGPDAEPTQAPDLQAATGQPLGGQESLLAAIGQGGNTIPQEAILSLLQGPSFGQRMGQAAAGGVAFMRGQANPATAILEQQQRQQMGIMQVLQRMQEQQDLKLYRLDQLKGADASRKETRELHKQTLLEKYSKDMIDSPDPEANLLGWTIRNDQMKAVGLPPMTPSVLQGLARKTLTKDTLAQAVSLYPSMPFPEIMALYPGIKPEHEPMLKVAQTSDDYRKFLGLPSLLENEYKKEEMEIKRAAAEMAVRRFDRDQANFELSLRKQDETERRNAAQEQRADTTLKLAIRGADRQDRSLALAEQRLDIYRKELDRKFETKDQKRQFSLDQMAAWTDEVDTLAERMDKKHLLQKTSKGIFGGLISGDLSASKTAFARATNPYDDDWVEFTKVLQGGAVGFERTVHNDIGPRAMAAFKGILSFMEKPATLSAIKQSTAYMRHAIEIARHGAPAANQELVYRSGGKTFIEKWNPGDKLPPDAEIITIDGKPPTP